MPNFPLPEQTLVTRQTLAYAAARPTYPAELFDEIVSFAPSRELVWEGACGSGQATTALAERFESVWATDVAAAQIERAPRLENVRYAVSAAEHVPMISDESVDLVVVATGAHWFELDRFYAECERVLKPGGAVALWAYGAHSLGDDRLDEVTRRFGTELLGAYWSKAHIAHVASGYATLPAPERLRERNGELSQRWRAERQVTLQEYLTYLLSWSASASYAEAHGSDPTALIEDALRAAWGDESEPRPIIWQLFARLFTHETLPERA